MNAERLHAIATATQQDLAATGAVQRLQQLRDALQKQVSEPQQPQHQQQVSSTLQQLGQSLGQAASNDFPPTWKQVLVEIGASDLLGKALLQRVREIFERNQITPSVAHQEIARLSKQLEGLQNALTQMTQGFSQLKIGAEELKAGECELGILVPRAAVENRLDLFGAELSLLHKTFGAFAELATGSRPGFEIRSISSTDLMVFLNLLVGVGACIAVAVERLVALYKQLLEIRNLRQQLKDQGLPDKSLQGVDSHANTHMRDGIEALIGELIQRYAGNVDEGRRNELRTELRVALNRLANRIDRGYNVEIRVKPIEQAKGQAVSVEDAARLDAINTIQQAAPGLQFLKLEAQPILSLPEPDENEPPAEK